MKPNLSHIISCTILYATLSFNANAAADFNTKTCETLLKDQANQACKEALKGNPAASYAMARLFSDPRNGDLVNIDYAYFWHIKLARQILKENLSEKDYIDILYNTGVLYADRLGITQDHKKALYWFEQAAQRNHSLAMVRLTQIYDLGLGVKKDDSKSHQWLTKAVDLNNPEAQVFMAQKLIEKNASQADETKAIELLKSAATQNSAQAHYILGNYALLNATIKTAKSLAQAKKYYANSCQLNYLMGCKRYFDLDQQSHDLASELNPMSLKP